MKKSPKAALFSYLATLSMTKPPKAALFSYLATISMTKSPMAAFSGSLVTGAASTKMGGVSATFSTATISSVEATLRVSTTVSVHPF
jgi:hypothetical protein